MTGFRGRARVRLVLLRLKVLCVLLDASNRLSEWLARTAGESLKDLADLVGPLHASDREYGRKLPPILPRNYHAKKF